MMQTCFCSFFSLKKTENTNEMLSVFFVTSKTTFLMLEKEMCTDQENDPLKTQWKMARKMTTIQV